jgi:hypothetical protein
VVEKVADAGRLFAIASCDALKEFLSDGRNIRAYLRCLGLDVGSIFGPLTKVSQ